MSMFLVWVVSVIDLDCDMDANAVSLARATRVCLRSK
jgi:hypothetical protein